MNPTVAGRVHRHGASLIDIDTALETCGVLVDHDLFRVVPLENRSTAVVYDARGIWPDADRLSSQPLIRLTS